MGITNSTKIIDRTSIECADSLRVTLGITATPDITENPVDIVLVLDNSGSMEGKAFARLRKAANQIIDILDEATGGGSGVIGGGSRVGIVSFEAIATIESPLVTNAVLLKQIVTNLDVVDNGNTNHYDAFSKAISLFSTMGTNEKVIIMLTDGIDTVGTNPDNIARYARETLGITIYMVGLEGNDGISLENLNEWATDPNASHVVLTPTQAELEELFEGIADNITNPGATNIRIVETLNDDFVIRDIVEPTVGTITQPSPQTLIWTIESLGVEGDEGASLEFLIDHIGLTGGAKAVNESIVYTDNEGNVVVFPNPVVTVDCGDTVEYSEACPEPVDVTTENCQDIITFDMSDVTIGGKGRIAEVNLTLQNVCPGRRVAVAVFLAELDSEGVEYPRGRKIFTIPAFTGTECQNVQINCIKFVLPEDLDLGGTPDTVCSVRQFRARAFANIIDYDYFPCCEETDE